MLSSAYIRLPFKTGASYRRWDYFPVSDDTVINLLADLRHFCAARRINFTACNPIAESRFNNEISGGQS
jgi:hypothetical protein